MADKWDDLEDDLASFEPGDEGVEDVPEVEPPADAAHVNRLLGAYHRLARKVADRMLFADDEVKRIRQWEKDRNAGLLRRMESIEGVLEGWMRAVAADDPKVRTESLPNGTLRLRAAQYRVEVTDEAELRSWLWTHRPDLLKITVEPKAGDVKAATATATDAKTRAKQEAERPYRVGPEVSRPKTRTAEEAARGAETWFAVVTGDGEVVPGVAMARADKPTFKVE
jgi:hypothetical protein